MSVLLGRLSLLGAYATLTYLNLNGGVGSLIPLIDDGLLATALTFGPLGVWVLLDEWKIYNLHETIDNMEDEFEEVKEEQRQARKAYEEGTSEVVQAVQEVATILRERGS